ncbi:MAG: hypothetical protein GQ582_12445 [Methyloprofundus sp.]|nr:hypothetical protein [Methyloprofundus sp.]
MYDVKITNDYMMAVNVNAHTLGTIAPNGGTFSITKLGNMILEIPGIGEAAFIDIADKKLPGYPEPSEHWGMLARFKTMEVYYRYEGQGQLAITIDRFGSLSFETLTGSAIIISLPELELINK